VPPLPPATAMRGTTEVPITNSANDTPADDKPAERADQAAADGAEAVAAASDAGGSDEPPIEPPDTGAEMGEPEPLPHGVQDIIDETDQLLADGRIGSPEQNLAHLRSMTDRDMEGLIVHTVSRSTGLPTFIAPHGRRGIVHTTTQTGETAVAYVPPRPEDRRPLLHDTLQTAQAQPTPERAFGLMGLQMGTIHPVPDGNVRTGHMLFNMRHEYTGSAADHKFLADTLTLNRDAPHADLNARRLGLNRQFTEPITAVEQARLGIAGPPIERVAFEEGGVMMRSGIALDEQQVALIQVSEPHFNVPAMLRTIQAIGRPVERYLMTQGQGETVLNATRFLEDLTPPDAELLDNITSDIKSTFVRSINALFRGDPQAQAIYGSVEDLLERMKNGLP
jgi:hypothetical protein